MEIIGSNLPCYAICPGCAAIVKYLPTELSFSRYISANEIFESGILKCPVCEHYFNVYDNRYRFKYIEEEDPYYENSFCAAPCSELETQGDEWNFPFHVD